MTPSRRLERLIFLTLLIALAAVWVTAALLFVEERRFALEQAQSGLDGTLVTLADFNELATLATGDAIIESSERRAAAM